MGICVIIYTYYRCKVAVQLLSIYVTTVLMNIHLLNEKQSSTNPEYNTHKSVACRAHRDVELAEKAIAELEKLPECEGSCGNLVTMSGVYAAVRRWDDMAAVRMKMKVVRKEKSAGYSSIEVRGEVSEFTAGD